MRTVVVAALAALAFTATASAAPPVPRLTYTKAVAYVTAQAKTHHAKVKCDAWSANGLTTRYACTFGTKTQLRLDAGAPCHLWAGLFAGPEFTLRIGDARYVTLCRAGWQKDLPTPWTQ